MSSYRGRRTPEQMAEVAMRKREALKQHAEARQEERSDIVLRAIIALNEFSQQDAWDARRAYKLELLFEDNYTSPAAPVLDRPTEPNIVCVAHSRVNPTFSHVVGGQLIRDEVEEQPVDQGTDWEDDQLSGDENDVPIVVEEEAET